MEVSSWENHPFLWAIYTMAMLNNQRVLTKQYFITWNSQLTNQGFAADGLRGGEWLFRHG